MIVVIVDGYSTGRFLPKSLGAMGVDCIHLRSTPTVPAIFFGDMNSDDYIGSLTYDGDLRGTARLVAFHQPSFVIAGAESGVTLAEELSRELGLPHNGALKEGARRDKYLMAKAVDEAGLAVPDSAVCTTTTEVKSWADAHGRWPIVVKPIDSAGTDNVYICDDHSELLLAFARTKRSNNLFGKPNEKILVQEFVHGKEYFINTISHNGEHHVAEVWCYHKFRLAGAGSVYDYEEPVPPDSPVTERLSKYVHDILTALDVNFGPAHTEVMWTEQGPVFIECGARLAGSVLPDAVRCCFGTSQLDLAALLIVKPESFPFVSSGRYNLHGSLRYVCLIAPADGVLASGARNLLATLPSYAGCVKPLEEGVQVARTIDSTTSPGTLYLHHLDPAVVEKDYATLRQWERDRFYKFTS